MAMFPKNLGEWITPLVDDTMTRDHWRRGHHRLQVAVDTIAYSNNVPVRILLLDRLAAFPSIVAKLLNDENILALLGKQLSEISDSEKLLLAKPESLHLAHRMLMEVADTTNEIHSFSEQRLMRAYLLLAPYIERKVWLTEMGNPLPLHALCRTHDLWALHVLLWTWSNQKLFSKSYTSISNAIGIEGLSARTLDPFDIRELEGPPQRAMPVVGPYFEYSGEEPENSTISAHDFIAHFDELMESASRSLLVPDPRQDGTPTHEELVEAAQAKIPLSQDEASIRAKSVAAALSYFRNTEVANDVDLEGLDRTGWEVIAALCAWIARWEAALTRQMRPKQLLRISHLRLPLELRVGLSTPSGKGHQRLTVSIHEYSPKIEDSVLVDIENFLKEVEAPKSPKKEAHGPIKLPSSYRIDRPSRYIARVRERQAAAWTAQLTAINNLLLRYSPRVVEAGPDPFLPYESTCTDREVPTEARHLLRGYGARVCKHLVSLTRADGASAFWLDYSYSPPRLIRMGDYFRHAAHSADSLASWIRFDEYIWSPAEAPDEINAIRTRAMRESQNYRVAYTGIEDPPANDGGTKPPIEGATTIVAGNSKVDSHLASYFDCYPDPKPSDSMAVPLLVSGRVIGVLSITGIVPKQFDFRLLWALRRSANLIASCVAHANEVWHLRRLNYVFAQNGPSKLHVPVAERERNPLIDISRCLANIFLCSVANIWIQSASNSRRLELVGYNRPILFPRADSVADSIFEFYYTDPVSGAENIKRTFSSLALDLWKESGAASDSHMGRFVTAAFDSERPKTTGYDAETASAVGAELGADYILAIDGGASRFVRERIFLKEQGHGLTDIMAFALLKPKAFGWEPVGVVTLHDEGQLANRAGKKSKPWEFGWAPTVAQMQTHLPYLFRQAELLNGPETSGRTYIMHALRSELTPLTDRALRLQAKASASIGQLGSAYEKLKQISAQESVSRRQNLIEELSAELRGIWTRVEAMVIGATSQRIRFLANLANNYKTLSTLVTDVRQASDFQSVSLFDLLEQLVFDIRSKSISESLNISILVPQDLRVSLPEEWLRMVFRELIRNIEKYSEKPAVTIVWLGQERSIRFTNDCVFDPKTDTPDRLTEYRYRGSASRLPGRRAPPSDGLPNPPNGEGMGLWGIKQICTTLGVGFNLAISPKDSAAQSGLIAGTFMATLTFPAGIVNARQTIIEDDEFA